MRSASKRGVPSFRLNKLKEADCIATPVSIDSHIPPPVTTAPTPIEVAVTPTVATEVEVSATPPSPTTATSLQPVSRSAASLKRERKRLSPRAVTFSPSATATAPICSCPVASGLFQEPAAVAAVSVAPRIGCRFCPFESASRNGLFVHVRARHGHVPPPPDVRAYPRGGKQRRKKLAHAAAAATTVESEVPETGTAEPSVVTAELSPDAFALTSAQQRCPLALCHRRTSTS